MDSDIDGIKRKILPILKRHNIRRVSLFGSVVRGDAGEDSDVDILVQIDEDISLLDFIGIKLEIEEALGRKVDLVEHSAIKPLLREKILSELVEII